MNLKQVKYVLTLGFAFAIVGCQTDSSNDQPIEENLITFEKPTVIDGRFIVVYNNDNNRISQLPHTDTPGEYLAQTVQLKETFVNEFNNISLTEDKIVQVYGHAIKGFAADLTENQYEALKKDSRVQYIEEDKIIALAPPPGKGPGSGGDTGDGSDPAQKLPYGTTRVGGGTTTANGTAWIIDSGIDLDHPDLNVDANRSASFLRKGGPDDENGHGTHVAGTIAAINNDIGSVGVAPGSTVVSVRVLDRRGSGSLSGVIAGVDYVKANAANNDVANMSLGGGVSISLDNAVISASGTCAFVLAAGNESDDADNHSPARANGNNIYTISAMDNNDDWAYFSNYANPPVDYCAPGVGVFSTWKDGGYNTISGTSMAAPHAAGVILLGNPSSDGVVNNDPDGNNDPIIHN